MSWSLRWRRGLTVACCRVRDTDYNSPGSQGNWHKSFWRKLLQAKLQGENTATPISRKWDSRLTEQDVLQSKMQFSSQLVPPIRKLLQASYLYPSEGRQNENHSHRKLTKLITWIKALSNSVKLWAMLCGATKMNGYNGKFWQNVVHWRKDWKTTSAFLPWEPHE